MTDQLTIVVDWGTSNFRAYLVDAKGCCSERIDAADGLNNLQQPEDEVLMKHIGPWLQQHGKLVTILCGMVGSPSGWQLVPHLPAPASLLQLAQNCHFLSEFGPCPAWIVPGVSGTGIAGSFDVMRGEEVQFFGAQLWLAEQHRTAPELLCFPGTHNKWMDASSNTINTFSTTMSGELFGLLSEQSILAGSVDPDASWNDEAFEEGLKHSSKDGGLLHHLFSVRSLNLNGTHGKEAGLAYLSGLIIGHELNALGAPSGCAVGIIGAASLARRYQFALAHFGYDGFCIRGEDATIRGALAIAHQLSTEGTSD